MNYALCRRADIEEMNLQAALASVSEQRRQHALRYRQEHDQRLSVAAYQLLQRLLRQHYGISEPPVFTFNTHGKPALRDHPDIFFNLSHCREAAACVVGNAPVGIDVESVRDFDDALLAQTMSDDERRHILSSPNPRQTFTRLWTMKESLLKLTGEGLVADMRKVLSRTTASSGPFRFHTTVYPQFVCTVCEGI